MLATLMYMYLYIYVVYCQWILFMYSTFSVFRFVTMFLIYITICYIKQRYIHTYTHIAYHLH